MVTPESECGFRIECVPETFLQRRVNGNMTGIVYIRCGAKTWPEPDWNDFVSGVVCLWLDEVKKLIEGKPASLRFMDGPLGVHVVPAENGMCRVRAWKNYDDAPGLTAGHYDYHWECRVALNDVILEMLRFAAEVFDISREKGWYEGFAPFEAAYARLKVPRN